MPFIVGELSAEDFLFVLLMFVFNRQGESDAGCGVLPLMTQFAM
jgi:hypothetical protein